MKSSDIRIYRFLTSLEGISRGQLFVLNFGLVVILGLIDYYTGFEFSFSFFYLIPVTLTAWPLGRKAGLAFSAFCAVIWLTSNVLSGREYSHPAIGVWNTLLRFGFYSVTTILLSELRGVLEQERFIASTDPLTGALNRRSFYEVTRKRIVIANVAKRPYTVVYFDLDNFKAINDKLGHDTGDQLLKEVVNTIQSYIRSTDFLARLGGDEFALLLFDMDHANARVLVPRLRDSLLETMQKNNWQVTFSIGVLTVAEMPNSLEELVSEADKLMYDVKNKKKDSIQYAVFDE